jgi:steroid 5-alpha reductase family enzyme
VSGIPLGPFGLTLLATAVALAVMMAITFAVALKAGRHSVVDSAWGIGIALTAVVSLLASAGHGQPARRYLLLAAAVIWGLRLSGYVTWRNHGQGEDPRYRDLLNKAKGNRNLYALRSIYLIQALTLWLACLPIQAGMLERAPVGAVTVVGGVLWLGGFVFESVGDWQLARFKADPANRGQIMNRGLWQYTRHPNYFGDFCMWWGLFLIALGSVAELPTAIGPLLMTFLLIRGTGGRMTDRRMAATRPQYADYAARTSGFFPLPPRRSRLGRRPRRAAPGRCQVTRPAAAAVMGAAAPHCAAAARPGTGSGTSARPARAVHWCWRSDRAVPPAR